MRFDGIVNACTRAARRRLRDAAQRDIGRPCQLQNSAPAGAFLAALVLYATVTGNLPLDLPYFSAFPIDADTQANLKVIASETVQIVPPRRSCPQDMVARRGANAQRSAT